MKKCTRYVGLDDSKNSIDVAVASEGRDGEVRSYGSIPNTGNYRDLLALGANCMVAAPSKTPRRSGDRIKTDRRDAIKLARLHRAGELHRIKTDRRDAIKLARLHRAGELHPVWVLDEESEAMRDLTRAREDAKYVQTKARQRLGSFLLRHGRRYPGRSHWTKTHLKWLAEQKFSQPSQQICLDEYVEAIRQASARVQRLEAQVRELVSVWSLEPVVSAMTAHRGVSLVVATTVCAELGDLTRFERVRELMGFVGLVPSLHATGLGRRVGAITKTGNGHVRRVLVEAAWAYRHPARRTAHIQRSLKDQPEEVQAISWKGQVRLCGRHRRMIARGKHPNKVAIAIARELLAFLWATARMAKPMSPAA